MMHSLPQNNNRSQPKSSNDLHEVMQTVLKLAKEKGATDASVATHYDSGFSVDVRMSQVDTVEFNEDKGVSVTVYLGQRQGSASSSDTSAKALESMVTAAYNIAQVSAADACFGLPDAELMTNDYPELDLYHHWEITPSAAIEAAISCEEYARSLDKRITNSDGVNVSSYDYCHGYANSQGGVGIIKSSLHTLSCSLISQEKSSMQRDYDYTTSRVPENLISVQQLASSAVERATSRLHARKIKTQQTPVIFSSRVSSSLLSAFISAISGGNLYRNNSFLMDTLGESLFPDTINIYEQPHLLRALGSAPFDGEGVPTRNNQLVKDGRLCQYVLGSYSARRLGLKTTANSGGVFNLTIDPTTGNLEDMLQQLGTGLLVTELMGRGVNGLTGDYSQGALGFWVENGCIQFPVEEITIAGNLKDMFKKIVAVGNDINPNSATSCGSICIEQMMVAGI